MPTGSCGPAGSRRGTSWDFFFRGDRQLLHRALLGGMRRVLTLQVTDSFQYLILARPDTAIAHDLKAWIPSRSEDNQGQQATIRFLELVAFGEGTHRSTSRGSCSRARHSIL